MFLGGMYGVSLATLGVLTTLCTALSVDAFGPIADNACGIAEMAELGAEVRARTDAMLPYIFSALTMKAVGKAALEMVEEVRRQFREEPGIMDGTVAPDCDRCIMIPTEASLKEMVVSGLLVIATPLLIGFLLGLPAGALVNGVQCALSAWDNAKKFIVAGLLENCDGKGSDEHRAAIIGDTVGDPLKDTSGPALNILIKLMGIISVVFAKGDSVAASCLGASLENREELTRIVALLEIGKHVLSKKQSEWRCATRNLRAQSRHRAVICDLNCSKCAFGNLRASFGGDGRDGSEAAAVVGRW